MQLASPPAAGARPPRRARPALRCAASAAEAKAKPDWAGAGFLSAVVNAAISTPLLYDVMKLAARSTLISTAERNGVPWREEVQAWSARKGELETLAASLADPALSPSSALPEYYVKPFHAYAEGNLCWLAAQEAGPATLSMALRVWPQEAAAGSLSPAAAQARLRDSYTDALAAYRERHGLGLPAAVLDVGCGAGISTRHLSRTFPAASVLGLDASVYMLAVAAAQAAEGGAVGWRHALAERTGLPADSFDLVSASFIFHELPAAATADVLAEAVRLLRPGGVFALTDNDPRSAVIQGLPPLLFTLMKSTEPHSDQYYAHDVEGAMRAAGLVEVESVATDPRHRAVVGRLPAAAAAAAA